MRAPSKCPVNAGCSGSRLLRTTLEFWKLYREGDIWPKPGRTGQEDIGTSFTRPCSWVSTWCDVGLAEKPHPSCSICSLLTPAVTMAVAVTHARICVELLCPIWQLLVANQHGHCTCLLPHIKMIIFRVYWTKENILYLIKYSIRYSIKINFTVPFILLRCDSRETLSCMCGCGCHYVSIDQHCFGVPTCSLRSLLKTRTGSTEACVRVRSSG